MLSEWGAGGPSCPAQEAAFALSPAPGDDEGGRKLGRGPLTRGLRLPGHCPVGTSQAEGHPAQEPPPTLP